MLIASASNFITVAVRERRTIFRDRRRCRDTFGAIFRMPGKLFGAAPRVRNANRAEAGDETEQSRGPPARSKARGDDCINKHCISNTQEFATRRREAFPKSSCFHIPRDLRLIGTLRLLSRSLFALTRSGHDSPPEIATRRKNWRKN